MKSKAFSVLTAIVLALFAISASIAAPILCRPFYYAHIEALNMPERTGWSHEQIRKAYDDVLDYLLKDAPFATGDLAWSESGMSHFADCKVLFKLDLWIFALSDIALAALILRLRTKKTALPRLADRGPSFWAAVGMLALFGSFGAFAASDFDRAFTLFHKVFFPGKTNWVFDARTDQIILVMPEEFFRNCGILIGGLLAVFIAAYILAGRKRRAGSADRF
jgi:integral membrane protein (TIGR01906 family)